MSEFNIEELKKWLIEQAGALSEQHAQMTEDRLRFEGRHQACDIILTKIAEMEGVETLSPTDAEEAAAEASP